MCHNLLSKLAFEDVQKPPAIERSTDSRKSQPGTPPHDVIEEMAKTIVTTIAAHKNETSSSLVTAKRSILPQLSSKAKKKKED
ncbi:hypothetical protein Tco_0955740 [Tanacetum coccineum]|uniref:Uncharacterized protein n=1 Tax=Tanacetum coccineum TaxID=301880 RepID=A0ABQ5E825_9ASTR